MTELLSHPVPALIVFLGVLVFFHELGHFLVGRWCGIAVEIFSIGFGPKILSYEHKGTDYRLCWIPLGGYVKFYGAMRQEEVPEFARGREFYRAPLLKRIMTVAAGPIANFILAVIGFSFMGFAGIQHPAPLIGDVLEGSPAENAGVLPGDLVDSINGISVTTWRDIERMISGSAGTKLNLSLKRDGVSKQVELTPAVVDSTNMFGKKVSIGRAGIARGYVLPILTVLDAESSAAKAGIFTGEIVKAVESNGQVYKIENFQKFNGIVARSALEGVKSLRLHLVPGESLDQVGPKGPALGVPESVQPRFVELQLEAPQDPVGLATQAPGHQRKYLWQLGITDSQLTIASSTDGAIGLLKKGDRLVSWGSTKLTNFFSLQEQLIANKLPEIELTIQREFVQKVVSVALKPVETQQPSGIVTVYVLPVEMGARAVEPPAVEEKYGSPFSALAYGFRETGRQTGILMASIFHLFIGDVPLKALGGPIMIAKVAGEAAKLGWQTFVGSMALISINLGLLNLLPIPVLDGGQLVLYFLEGVRRKPLAERAIENFQKVGFVMIMALVVLATYNDFSRFWKSMLQGVVGLFQ